MLETDILYAYVKQRDWLKPVATRVMRRITEGEFGSVYASREVLHELYYVSVEEGVPLDVFIARAASLTVIPNLQFLNTTPEVDLLAFTFARQYGLTSVFDAYYAATAANQVPDHAIVSTDPVFDRVPSIKRIDPRKL